MIQHEGDQGALQTAIRMKFFSTHSNGNLKNQNTLAMNCRLGMKAYGLIDENTNITSFGRKLYSLRDDNSKLYDTLATYILLHLNGMRLVKCIQDMTCAGEKINLTTLRDNLIQRGIYYPSGGKHPSIMRLWLAKAGVFTGSHWRVDDLRVAELSHLTLKDFDTLARLTREQRAYLLALANTDVKTPQLSNEIARLAETVYGIKFPEKSLPKLVLNALVEAGYIIAKKTTQGRGAKPFLITPTDKLVAEIVTPVLEQLKGQVDPKLIDLLRKSLKDILIELNSDNTYIRGLALEALAFKLMRILDLDYVGTRLRGQATGGAEVDLIFESSRLVFSRWQIQCKNTAKVSLDDVAKEVGLTHFLHSNVIVIVTTGHISEEARHYSDRIMSDSNLCIVLLSGEDLEILRGDPIHIIDIFNREARHAMSLKILEI